jgi:AmmeMemoRadiSam system protein B
MFYPDDPDELHDEIASLLHQVPEKKIDGIIRGIISPHAGYQYSGFTAANAYALLRGREYEAVVIVSPSHREYFDGVSVYQGEAYETPLGTVSLNAVLRENLRKEATFVSVSDIGHREEHAIEVQIPFLQHVLHHFSLLPIVIGDQARRYCLGLGEALGKVLSGVNYLLVASTDLSHYYPWDTANVLDQKAIDDVASFDYERMMTELEDGSVEACGGGPTVAVMAALQRLNVKHIEVLHHCNSGDVTGDRSRVVGYCSAVAYE